eukprot:CAMPEP_0203771896 /NCGR_PEP_ID=MMETSP0099_2-20121227/3692_1 /ASSEMBLY_ACC=CAM_ASM_000209 /TAXON_ID=96639 /ORGANISM=" , Strain NY0313808BC1" /LENGTH=349 /DNA_ID=CAMNT_0050669337 /DNA_START=184 /DNA_END=1234 /DNA_ORIENTATION=-
MAGMASRIVQPLPSTIEGAGTGLFAVADIRAGTEIIEYTGSILTLEQAKVLRNRTYLKAVTLNRHIDGNGPGSSMAKYINDHVDGSKHNVKFKKIADKIMVVSTRDIDKGEELFIDYGRGHWLFCGAGAFLGLEITVDQASKEQQLVATKPLSKGEVVCCLRSRAMEDIDRLSQGVGFATAYTSTSANCRLKPSPFVKDTIMVSALRRIPKGENIVVRYTDRLYIKPSGIPGAGLGAFALTDLAVDDTLGQYEGQPVSNESLSLKQVKSPGAAKYFFRLNSQHSLDPSDEKDKYGHSEMPMFALSTTALTKKKSTVRLLWFVTVKTLKPISKDDELFVDYGPYILSKHE